MRQWGTGGIHGNASLFDGQWRVDARSNNIVDARQLPREVSPDNSPEEFASKIKQLRAVAASISTRPNN